MSFHGGSVSLAQMDTQWAVSVLVKPRADALCALHSKSFSEVTQAVFHELGI